MAFNSHHHLVCYQRYASCFQNTLAFIANSECHLDHRMFIKKNRVYHTQQLFFPFFDIKSLRAFTLMMTRMLMMKVFTMQFLWCIRRAFYRCKKKLAYFLPPNEQLRKVQIDSHIHNSQLYEVIWSRSEHSLWFTLMWKLILLRGLFFQLWMWNSRAAPLELHFPLYSEDFSFLNWTNHSFTV